MSDATPLVPQVTNAVAHVISSIIPPRAYTFLFALLPGLFFETSVLLANPALVYTLVVRAQPFIGPSHSASVALALLLAFIVGDAFMLGVLLVQRFFGYLYRFRAFIWDELCAWPLFPLIMWLQRKPWFGRRGYVMAWSRHVQQGRMRSLGVPTPNGIGACWSLFARQLLKKRYGIEATDLNRLDEQDDWNVLFDSLGTLTLADLRGSLTMIVSEATGWCGVAAMWIAPSLRNRYFVYFSMFLIVAGMLHDWYVAGNMNNPRFVGVLKIRALLRDFRNPAKPEPDEIES